MHYRTDTFKQVVPKGSAKINLGPPLETIVPVDADHRQLVQFPSRDSKQYDLVRSNLVAITSSFLQELQLDSKCPLAVGPIIPNSKAFTAFNIEPSFLSFMP
jgi:hypothetical protein